MIMIFSDRFFNSGLLQLLVTDEKLRAIVCSESWKRYKLSLQILSSFNSMGALACDFQQCGILTIVDSDEPLQPPFKLRNSKWCSVSS